MIGLLQLMTAMKLSKKKGKAAAVSGVYPGFFGSRILSPRQDRTNHVFLIRLGISEDEVRERLPYPPNVTAIP